nr:hypothetical protein Iba_chr01cCG14510 [Ipomoea batatas]GMC54995.1 hypothetical protein Iba_chr01eCG3230 [Ipomoea batatas]
MPRRVQRKIARQIFRVWNGQVDGDGRHVADTVGIQLVKLTSGAQSLHNRPAVGSPSKTNRDPEQLPMEL